MSDQTGVNPEDLRQAANRIKDLMSDDDLKIFGNLSTHNPTAGNFPTGQWLVNRVNDRIAAVQDQAKVLKTAFGDMCDSLHTVANDLQKTDESNAALVQKVNNQMGTLKTNINKDLGSTSS